MSVFSAQFSARYKALKEKIAKEEKEAPRTKKSIVSSKARSFIVGFTQPKVEFPKKKEKPIKAQNQKRNKGKTKNIPVHVLNDYAKTHLGKPISFCTNIEYAWIKSKLI